LKKNKEEELAPKVEIELYALASMTQEEIDAKYPEASCSCGAKLTNSRMYIYDHGMKGPWCTSCFKENK